MTLTQWLELIAKWVNICSDIGMDPDNTHVELFGEDGAIYRARLTQSESGRNFVISLTIT